MALAPAQSSPSPSWLSDAEAAALAERVGPLPAVRSVAGARERIRASHVATGRRTGILDDDPTGSQSVHDIGVVTVVEADALAAELVEQRQCFMLTNTRSLPEAGAVGINRRAAGMLIDLEDRRGSRIDVISRSDSTLRGHVLAELRALDAVCRERSGRGYDAALFVPAYLEAGRFTAGDVHWARVGGSLVPAGETEFARDATFGYQSSNLRDFLTERSGGAITADQVLSIGLDDIRVGGPSGRRDPVRGTGTRGPHDRGQRRSLRGPRHRRPRDPGGGGGGPIVRVPHGTLVRPCLRWPRLQGAPHVERHLGGHSGGNGLLVVGSHVGLTSTQLEVARQVAVWPRSSWTCSRLVDPACRDAHVVDVGDRAVAALAERDVLLSTTRALLRGEDADASLQIAGTVSNAVVEVVQRMRAPAPAWVVAKGGITSHDVAVRGLGIRRAEVVGQMLPGMVSVWRAVDARRKRSSAIPTSCSRGTSATGAP